MYILLLLRLLFGYVRIEVEGYYIERLVNICTNKKILIWNLKKRSDVKLYLNIGIKDFKKLYTISKSTNCKIKVLQKKGLPFLFNKYKKRKLFVLFLIIVFLVVFISSKYVWSIDIIIENNFVAENILSDLEEFGLKKGMLKSNIDTDSIINHLLLKRDDISWIGINIVGTKVIVNVVMSESIPEIID